jgi:DNA polymerase V
MGADVTAALDLEASSRDGLLYAAAAVPAGFPSPAQDCFEGRIDLNKHLIADISCTFLVRVSGHSMDGAGICDGDELVVDRSLTPADGNVVVAIIDGELTVKRLRLERGQVRLAAENPGYPDVIVPELAELSIWGVVSRCLHHV